MQILYEKPVRIELSENQVFVDSKPHHRDVRRLSEMRDVLRGHVVLDVEGDRDMYYMFRNVAGKDGLRYDITVMPGKTVHGECMKTYGHGHPEAEDNLTFPEVYQVLLGTAVFIFQQTNRNRSVNVTMIKANAGEVVLIPPNMAHTTINPTEGTTVLANLVADGFEPDYSEYKDNHGAAFYYLEDGNIEQNANYVVKNLDRLKSTEFNKKFGFSCGDILAEFEKSPEKFAFLKKPSLLFKK
jgi:glucose-6-phosphate isomerase